MHKRHSIRLSNYDYSCINTYFITICTKDKKHTLSKIDKNAHIHLTDLGSIVEFYLNISYLDVTIHQYVIMPNHIHAIIKINNNNIITLGKFLKEFKSKICRNYNKLYNSYKNSIWQRNYYEHIIRNSLELHRIEKYIKNNPYKWIE